MAFKIGLHLKRLCGYELNLLALTSYNSCVPRAIQRDCNAILSYNAVYDYIVYIILQHSSQ